MGHPPEPNSHGAPGNDVLVTLGMWGVNSEGTLADPLIQWRTILHEVGHNLGLRHCGYSPDFSLCDTLPPPPPPTLVYESLMSYAHQTTSGTGVNSYSPRMPGTPDPTFDDWFNLRQDFSQALVHIGNTRGLGLGAEPALGGGAVLTSEDIGEPELNLDDHIQANGPLDLEAPDLDIVSPAVVTNILQGSNLTVTVMATDNAALSPVTVTFDVDGSGAIDVTGESLIATPIGSDQFEATFVNISGPDSLRDIVASVTDPADHIGMDTQPTYVPEPAIVTSLAFGLTFIALLQRARRSR